MSLNGDWDELEMERAGRPGGDRGVWEYWKNTGGLYWKNWMLLGWTRWAWVDKEDT